MYLPSVSSGVCSLHTATSTLTAAELTEPTKPFARVNENSARNEAVGNNFTPHAAIDHGLSPLLYSLSPS